MRVTPLVAALLTIGTVAPAHAERHSCPLVESETIGIDGMLDDWKDVRPVRVGGVDGDASFDLRCQYDGAMLELSIDVRDDLLVRNTQARGKLQAGEDHLELELSAGGAPLQVTLFPGYVRSPPRRTVGGGRVPAWLTIEDTLQKKGWSAELHLPLARVAGWTAATPALSLRAAYHDSDRFAAGRAETDLAASLDLDLGGQQQLLQGFLTATRLRAGDLTVDVLADVDRTHPGAERLVAGGGYIGVLGERFAYVRLPVAAARDVIKVEAIDLRGDGGRVVLAHVRQTGTAGAAEDGGRRTASAADAGTRELLLGFAARSGQLAPLFAVEIRKELGGRVLSSRWKVVPRGAGRKRPELVIESAPAVGWDEDTYDEVPAPDADPIHVPWDEDRWGAVYWLDGDQVRSRVLSGKRSRR